ncbi:hypothetical protein NPIL_198141 [Nephila pilipes]|uniref:Uncharacterized protein n=1 Tax=Nephila pilipes TaxID=299642 RepID=A0A8X6N6G1_NEPPI|nr:hypothetical protein NPIL_198141 [Nephila pilipes]
MAVRCWKSSFIVLMTNKLGYLTIFRGKKLPQILKKLGLSWTSLAFHHDSDCKYSPNLTKECLLSLSSKTFESDAVAKFQLHEEVMRVSRKTVKSNFKQRKESINGGMA